MTDHRLFVGNLPNDVSESAIRKLFGKYEVSKVEVKRKKVLDNESVFAFVNISSDCVNKCLSELRNKEWKNCNLKIESAKESFLDRLKKEHNEKNKLISSECTKQLTTTSLGWHQNSSGIKNKKILFDSDNEAENTFSSKQNDDLLEEAEPRKRNLPMFRGTASIESVRVDHKTSEPYHPPQKKLNIQNLANDACNSMKKFEEFSDVWKDEPVRNDNFHRKINFRANSHLAKEKKEETEVHSSSFEVSPIKKSLRNDAHENLKVGKTIAWKSVHRNGDNISEEIHMSKNEENMCLDSMENEDDRFKLNEKFFDVSDAEMRNEKQNCKKAMSKLNESKLKMNSIANEVFQHRQLVRYDPTRPDHNIIEKSVPKNVKSLPDSKKKKSKKKTENPKLEPDQKFQVKPEVSKEKYYAVADTLKNSFKKSENQTGFSLSALFDQKIKQEISSLSDRKTDSDKELLVNNYVAEDIPRREINSDSEEDSDIELPVNVSSDLASEKVLGKCGVWGETFFFKENDSRFKEAIDFFKPAEDKKVADFDRQRCKLRDIVRKKLHNSRKDNKLFKLKLGGKLNKSKFKMRLKKARNY